MARAAALLLVGALGVALCAAIEHQESTTTRNEESEKNISLKESKEIFDNLRYDLEPATSHDFPYSLALPVPWPDLSSAQLPKTIRNDHSDEERINLIPLEDNDIRSDANGNSENVSEDLVNTATRMMMEEAKRRRLFKKKMHALMQSRLPNPESKKEPQVLKEKPENVTEGGEILELRGEAMMNDAFRPFRRIAHIMPLMHHLLSSRLSRPVATLSGPFATNSEEASPKVDALDGDDGQAVLVMGSFSSSDAPSNESAERPRLYFRKTLPEDSVRIDVTFVPVQSESFPRRLPLPLREMEVNPKFTSGRSETAISAIPFPVLPLISRVLSVMQSVRQKFTEDANLHALNFTEQSHSTKKKTDPFDRPPSPQQVLPIPSQPASKDTAALKLTESVQTNVKLEDVGEEMQTRAPVVARNKREVRSTTEREKTNESSAAAAAAAARLLLQEDEDPQRISSRVTGPEIFAVGESPPPLGAMRTGMPLYSPAAPDVFLNGREVSRWKQFFKLPLFAGRSPLGYDKMAYQLKAYPKFPMPVQMAGARQLGIEYALNNLATAQAAETTAAEDAEEAAANAAQISSLHPRSCVPPCARPLRGQRSARGKRNVRSGGAAAPEQALDASAAGGEKKKAPATALGSKISAHHKASEGTDGSRFEQLPPSFFQRKTSNQEVPQYSSRSFAPLQKTPIDIFFDSDSAEDEKQNSNPGTSSVGFYKYPFEWPSEFPSEEKETKINIEFPEVFDGSAREANPTGWKEFREAKTAGKMRKKVPSRTEQLEVAAVSSELPGASAGPWAQPAASAFGVIPFVSPLQGSVLGGGDDEPLFGDRVFPRARPRRSLGSGGSAGDPKEDALWAETEQPHGLRHGGAHRASKSRGRGRARSRLRANPSAKAAGGARDKKAKHAREEHMPFLDPSMTQDSNYARYHRRDMGNDFHSLE